MYQAELKTEYASAEREKNDKLQEQIRIFKTLPHFNELMDVVPELFVVLNDKRQIVYANQKFLNFLGDEGKVAYGQRPGEVLGCKYANETGGGCGTTKHCKTCGAVNSILTAIKGTENVAECSIINVELGSDLDLRVWTKPFYHGNEEFILFAVEDISHEKRRRALERIFFHDIINTAGGLNGIMQLIRESPEEIEMWKDTLYNLTNSLIDEIFAQKDLSEAENNELIPSFSPVRSIDLLKSIALTYSKHSVAKDKEILIENDSENIIFETDNKLVSRVIGNLVKNALEASNDFSTVTMSCHREDDILVFKVHNDSVMSEEVKLQVFKRSFSTKGSGRGLGTYSIRLLTEKYLNGKVWFESDVGEGTDFFVSYPISVSR